MNKDKSENNIKDKFNKQCVAGFMNKIPVTVLDSFDEQQLIALQKAVSETSWKKHPIDFRSSLSFFSYQYYYVFIAGRDQRQMTRKEIRFKRLMLLAFVTLFITFSTLLGLLVIYLIKSAMGIDIFPNFSFGIWTWFQDTYLI